MYNKHLGNTDSCDPTTAFSIPTLNIFEFVDYAILIVGISYKKDVKIEINLNLCVVFEGTYYSIFCVSNILIIQCAYQ